MPKKAKAKKVIDRKSVSMLIDAKLYVRARKKMLKNDLLVRDLFEDALRTYVAQERKAS